MSIEEQLTAKLKDAMRAKNTREVSVIRMVKTQATKDKTAPGFSGEADDAFWLGVVKSYVKQQTKALAEFQKIGESAADQIAEATYEIEYLSPFLPSLKSEQEVSTLVDEAIARTGAVGSKMVGRVVGAVMKDHRDEVDPAMVKKLVAQKLG